MDIPARTLLQKLQSAQLLPEDWDEAAPDHQALAQYTDAQALLNALVLRGQLTSYQAERIKGGCLGELIVGTYRIMEELGSGTGKVVYKGAHLRMGHEVAIKVIALPALIERSVWAKGLAQLRAVARLRHPNIPGLIDIGAVEPLEPAAPRYYFVSEFFPGQDLYQLVARTGPLTIQQACALGYQIASALTEAHQQQLAHGDLKPGNIRVLGDGQVRVLDFGLARALGTATAHAAADGVPAALRADLAGLGQILFWCLSGKTPPHGAALPPPSSLRADVPDTLDKAVAAMVSGTTADVGLVPREVMRILLPFLSTPLPPGATSPGAPEVLHKEKLAAAPAPSSPGKEGTERDLKDLPSPRAPFSGHGHRILIVDDEPAIRHFSRLALQAEGLPCDEVANGTLALQAFQEQRYDLVLLDIDMPGIKGLEVCRRLRQSPPEPYLKIIMFSGRTAPDDLAQMLLTGADDYLIKPFTPMQLQARVQAALRLKAAQERSDLLNHDLLVVNRELEQHLNARAGDLIQARNALVLALAKLAEYRDTETGEHLLRIQVFSRRLAEEAAKVPIFAAQIDDNFIDMLACCAPLHDIGKVGLPDNILLKPSKLEPHERLQMQTHTTIGADTLQQVARQHGFALAFLNMSIDIARHHHERYDGHGYPDRLVGSAIPLSARLVTICDVYDALRSRRVYKPAMTHADALKLMETAGGQFDPALLQVFQRCAGDFERIYAELSD
jgi:response regulator RpfG family c-di-GMP phosphodiesterase